MENINSLNLGSKTIFARYPYFLHPNVKAEKLEGDIKILHVTNFDWGETDKAPGRNSFKNNQIFIQGVMEAFALGFHGLCTISFRGPDRLLARKWIEESDFDLNFRWIEQVTPRELRELILANDVVVDQFYGAFGMIAYETMSLGKPVVLSLNEDYLRVLYGTEAQIPTFNLETSSQITNFFLTVGRQEMAQVGERAEKWVRVNHDVHVADFSDLVHAIRFVSQS